LKNPWRGNGLPKPDLLAEGGIATDAAGPRSLFQACPKAAATPLESRPDLAAELGISALYLKDERGRMGLGSFKALGAAYAIAKEADRLVQSGTARSHENALSGRTYVCASAGNHGLSLAAGAPLFGAKAAVFIANTVPEAFAERLRAKGAAVVRAGSTYEESMAEAGRQAAENGWELLPDSTWPGMTRPGHDVMEGYLIMGDEVAGQAPQTPTHVFLQAGVGGLAAACAASARAAWGEDVCIIIVEPEAAPALFDSIKAGEPVIAPGPVSNMGRLDCKEPSHVALKYLAKEADGFVTISDAEAQETADWLGGKDLATTPSGAAGVAALRHGGAQLSEFGLTPQSRVLCYLSEGPEDV